MQKELEGRSHVTIPQARFTNGTVKVSGLLKGFLDDFFVPVDIVQKSDAPGLLRGQGRQDISLLSTPSSSHTRTSTTSETQQLKISSMEIGE